MTSTPLARSGNDLSLLPKYSITCCGVILGLISLLGTDVSPGLGWKVIISLIVTCLGASNMTGLIMFCVNFILITVSGFCRSIVIPASRSSILSVVGGSA